MTQKTDEVVAKYVELRDRRAALKADYTKEDEKLKSAMETIESYLSHLMHEMGGVDSLKTAHGTAFKKVSTKASFADRDLARKYALETGNLDVFELRASSTGVKTYMDEHDGALPPGFSVFTEETVQIRRSN